MKRAWVVASLVASIVAVSAWSAVGELGVPEELAGFRSWGKLTSQPEMVPYELSILCAARPPTRQNLERHGPHTNHFIMVFANSLAYEAIHDASASTFPPGAIIAKEKLRGSEVDGVAFMVKHPAGEFTESGGWEFLYFSSSGARPTYETCIGCHRAGGTKDFVFGRYGRPDAK